LIYTNAIVVSEVSFILIFKKCFTVIEIKELFNDFIHIEYSKDSINLAFDFMQQYNLKPNDALILATNKY